MTNWFRAAVGFTLLPLAMGLGGCALVSSSGPSVGDIRHDAKAGRFDLVEVETPEQLPPAPASVTPQAVPPPAPADYTPTLAAGDLISVTFFEIGVRLFSTAPETDGGAYDPSARNQKLANLEIDKSGNVRLPYLGLIRAAGETTASLGRLIERRMAGMSQNPQVVVSLDAAVGSAVLVSGVVARPGRIRLSAAREQVRDVLALAGGFAADPGALKVRLERHGIATEASATQIESGAFGQAYVEAGDRIDVLRQPRSYSIIGYSNQINEFPLPATNVSLVEAIAKAGGVNDNLADPAAVFLFRMESGADGKEDRPVIYHINMKRPYSYFLARNIQMRDNDVVYVGGAAANRPGRLLQIVSQIFTPVLLARSLTD